MTGASDRARPLPRTPGAIIAVSSRASKPGRQIMAARPASLRQFSHNGPYYDLRPSSTGTRCGSVINQTPDITFVSENTLKRHDHHHRGPFRLAPALPRFQGASTRTRPFVILLSYDGPSSSGFPRHERQDNFADMVLTGRPVHPAICSRRFAVPHGPVTEPFVMRKV